jgi:hypothetical protein
MRQLQQAAIGGVGKQGVRSGGFDGKAEIGIAALQIRDASGRDAVEDLTDDRVLGGFRPLRP